jgi:hypothetical protein
MDDLLIVRMSDRSKERFDRRSRQKSTPLGMNLGLALGLALGLGFASASNADPKIGMILGLAMGLAVGGLFGRFLKRSRPYKRGAASYAYEGMPFESEDDEQGDDDPSDTSSR